MVRFSMKVRWWWFVVNVFSVFDATDSILSYDNGTSSMMNIFRHDEGVLCEIRTLDIDFVTLQNTIKNETSAMGHDETTVCVTSSFGNIPQTYKITGPDDDGWTIGNGGLVRLRGPIHVDENDAYLRVTNSTEWEIEIPDQIHDRYLRSVPDHAAVIVRVTYMGREPSLSAIELQGRIHGTGPKRTDHSLRSQLNACSQGQYSIIPTTHQDIEGGVLDVSISKSLAGSVDSVLTLENLVVGTVVRRLGDALWHQLSHVMIVMPQHDDIRFRDDPLYLAYGYIGGTVTVFRDHWAGKLSILMHEIGHNLDLSHSGRNGDVYGDTSGYMGYGVDAIGGPLMCFNGQKHYATGWYNDRTRHLFPDDLPFAGWLAFFGDMTETEPVLWVLNLPGPERLFMQYNLARGINAGTRSNRNDVTITRDDGKLRQTSGVQSWWVGSVRQTQKSSDAMLRYRVDALRGDLLITVCNTVTSTRPAKVHLSIRFDPDGGSKIEAPSCRDPLLPFCDDDLYTRFWFNGRKRGCGWLARRILKNSFVRRAICEDVTHPGYLACPETCGVCHDHCQDDPSADFYVNREHGRKQCQWLSTRVHWQERLCVVGHDAFRLCPESCNRCD